MSTAYKIDANSPATKTLQKMIVDEEDRLTNLTNQLAEIQQKISESNNKINEMKASVEVLKANGFT